MSNRLAFTALEQEALACLQAHEDELYRLLTDLISIDTQNFGDSGREAACTPLLKELYGSLGLDVSCYCPDDLPGVTEHPLYWPGQHTDTRPNVTGAWRGRQPDRRLMLAAHSDTMPAGNRDAWSADPFQGVLRDGKVYGLGACDDKFGIAGSFMALKVLKLLHITLAPTVLLTAYCDEEFGGGNGALAACLHDPCELYLNLDGGSYEMWPVALGGGCFRLKLHRECVSDDFMPVYRVLAAFMEQLDAFGQRRRDELEQNPYYAGTPIARSAFRIGQVGCVGDTHTDAEIFFVVYTDKSQAEIHAELDAITAALQPVLEAAQVRTAGFEAASRFFRYGAGDVHHPAFETLHACAEEAAGRPVPICGSCLTDLSVFQEASGATCYNFGILRDFSRPGGAHQPDEFVDCQELMNFTKTLLLFLIRYGDAQREGNP